MKTLKDLKERIKELASEQSTIKKQRKTVKFEGERTISPGEAVLKCSNNKYLLRHMYILYGELRGKTQEQIEGNSKTPLNQYTLEKLRKEYKVETNGEVVCTS